MIKTETFQTKYMSVIRVDSADDWLSPQHKRHFAVGKASTD